MIDWNNFLVGKENWDFLYEVILRSALMFIVAIIAIRLIGKRGIMQGVFEIVTIVTLGSAAGDPMFYKDVGVLPAIIVFASVVIMYRITDFFIKRSKWLETIVEGKQVKLIRDGMFAVENFSKEELGEDKVLADLRIRGISHLGQVDAAYIEASGNVSVFFLPDEKIQYGLPILPELFDVQFTVVNEAGYYACAWCGKVEKLEINETRTCSCKRNKWVKAIRDKRVV